MNDKEVDLKIYIDCNKDAHVTRPVIRIFFDTADDEKKLREFYDGIETQLTLNTILNKED